MIHRREESPHVHAQCEARRAATIRTGGDPPLHGLHGGEHALTRSRGVRMWMEASLKERADGRDKQMMHNLIAHGRHRYCSRLGITSREHAIASMPIPTRREIMVQLLQIRLKIKCERGNVRAVRLPTCERIPRAYHVLPCYVF